MINFHLPLPRILRDTRPPSTSCLGFCSVGAADVEQAVFFGAAAGVEDFFWLAHFGVGVGLVVEMGKLG
jgi:hypothetical protein